MTPRHRQFDFRHPVWATTTSVLLVVVGGASVAFGQASAEISDADRELARIYLIGLLDGRQRMISGELRATGRESTPGSVDGDSATEFHAAFDDATGRFRFDRKGQERLFVAIYSGGGKTPKDLMSRGEWKTEKFEAKFIRTPERDLDWSTKDVVEVHAKAATEEGIAAKPFHVNTLGIITVRGNAKFWTCDQLIGIFQSQRVVGVSKEAGEVLKISWIFGPGDTLKRLLWIDAARDYAPIRMQLLERRDASNEKWSAPIVDAEVHWSRQNGIWVPVHSQEKFASMQQKQRAIYELQIEWLKVNEELDPSLFTSEGLNLPHFAMVVDDRLGKRIVTEKLGPHSAAINAHSDGSNETDLAVRRSPWVRILIIVNALILAVAVVFLLYRRWLTWGSPRH